MSPRSSREVALLSNPAAGKSRSATIRDAALARMRDSGLAVRLLEGRDPQESTDLAREALAAGVEALVVCGGDGTVNLAAQVLAGTGVPLGLIPAGTGNDVARYLGLSRGDPLAAADRVIAGGIRTIDLARCGSTYFVTVLAAGFDALVSERANTMTWPRGQMRYNLATVAELRTFRPLTYTLDLDGATRRLEAMLIAVANGPSFGGGLRIAEGASLDDGLLDVVAIKPMSKARLVATYPRLFRGTHTGLPEFERHRVHTVTISSPGIVAYADGDRFEPLPLTVECVPGALRLFT